MTGENELRSLLLGSQNADGGWPFRNGQSWTEPTALALLYLSDSGNPTNALAKARNWLIKRQRPDGSWPVNDQVLTSSWVTSLALLALAKDAMAVTQCKIAADWVIRQIYPEPPLLQRLVSRLLAVDPPHAQGSSPWFAGTAGWVIPTAFNRLALACWNHTTCSRDIDRHLVESGAYLLSRRCSDGGWNHGGSSFRSENATSYPETTGLALLALADTKAPTLAPALALANRMLQEPQSLEGLSWLEIGLVANRHNVAAHQNLWRPRTTRDLALGLLSFAAQRGNNAFIAKPSS
jgi:hypothetical protein